MAGRSRKKSYQGTGCIKSRDGNILFEQEEIQKDGLSILVNCMMTTEDNNNQCMED